MVNAGAPLKFAGIAYGQDRRQHLYLYQRNNTDLT